MVRSLTPTAVTPAIPVIAIDQNSTPAMLTRWVNFLDLCAVAVLRMGLLRADCQSRCRSSIGPMPNRWRYGSVMHIKPRMTGTNKYRP